MTAQNIEMSYESMLAGRGLRIGDQVVCDYRIPAPHQWWVAPLWVGVIEEVGTDAAGWNGSNSEAQFCTRLCAVRVRYLAAGGAGMGEFVEHDSIGHLRQLHFGVETASPFFSSDGDGYEKLRMFAARCGMSDRYPARAAAEMAVAA